MYRGLLIALVFSCEVFAESSGLLSTYAIKDSHNVPRGWHRASEAPEEHIVNLRIGLTQSDFAGLESNLYEVSDPSHERYGKHLSAKQVKDQIAPSKDTLTAVHQWLEEQGVDPLELDYSPAKDWIKVALPVRSVERLLQTKYHRYVHDSGDSLIRAIEWSLPQHLHEHIATIQPTSSFFRLQPRGKIRTQPTWKSSHPMKNHTTHAHVNESSVAAVCNASAVTPLCLRTLYGTVDYTVQAANANSIALNDFLGEINNRSDIEIYLQTFRPEAASAAYTFKQISIANGTLQQTSENTTQLDAGTGIEGNLDAETILGIAWPTPLIAYSTGGLNPVFVPDAYTPTDSDEPYLVWLDYILSLSDDALPKVISTSYADDEQTIPYSYASHACNMFAQLGARGVTLLFGSGDEGVGADGYCFKNDGSNSSAFIPEFPSSCPFVTTVGATKGFNPEVAAYDPIFTPAFTSGGGFSNYFPRPSYQDFAVSAYLSTFVKSNYSGLFNASGRAYPDLAAQGQDFSIVWNGSVIPVDGTSASTPTAAAVLALVNDALIAGGRGTLGWLNPWLYQKGFKAFTDVTQGSSAGCDTAGFPAEVGWDAVTGWGTPYFPAILSALGVEGQNGSKY